MPDSHRTQPSLELETLHYVFREFADLYERTYIDRALDRPTKELIALGISIARDCEACATYHVDELRRAGAAEHQIVEALALSLMTAGSTAIPLIRRVIAHMADAGGT